jgi:hypothetical protein
MIGRLVSRMAVVVSMVSVTVVVSSRGLAASQIATDLHPVAWTRANEKNFRFAARA